jgi:hypothetical protein
MRAIGRRKTGEFAQKSERICSKWTKFTRMNKKLVKSYKNKEKQGRKLGGCVVECGHLCVGMLEILGVPHSKGIT